MSANLTTLYEITYTDAHDEKKTLMRFTPELPSLIEHINNTPGLFLVSVKVEGQIS